MIDFTLDHGSDGAELRLSGDLTIESAQEVKVIVLEAMEGAGVLSLDLSALDRVDAAGQRLAAGRKDRWVSGS